MFTLKKQKEELEAEGCETVMAHFPRNILPKSYPEKLHLLNYEENLSLGSWFLTPV